MTARKRRLILIVSSAAFLLLAPVIMSYTLGYRLDGNFRLSKTGGLYISSPITGSEIFIKNRKEKTTNILQSGFFLQSFPRGFYPIAVTKKGFWPWFKELEIKEGMVTEAKALLIPQEPKATVIAKGNFSSIWSSPYDKIILIEEKKSDNNYQIVFYLPETNTFLTDTSLKAANLFYFKREISRIFWEKSSVTLSDSNKIIKVTFNFDDQTAAPTLEKKDTAIQANHKYEKTEIRGKERVWWDKQNNNVWLEWLGDKNSAPYYICDVKPCESNIYFIAGFRSSVKNVDFFPGRRDVLIAAVQNNVFTIEVDGRGERLMRPLYKGKNPTFATLPGQKNIYALDDGILFIIDLEQ